LNPFKIYVLSVTHLFCRKQKNDWGYERATNLVGGTIALLAIGGFYGCMAIAGIAADSLFKYEGNTRLILYLVALAWVFGFNYLYKKEVIKLYEEELNGNRKIIKNYDAYLGGFVLILISAFIVGFVLMTL